MKNNLTKSFLVAVVGTLALVRAASADCPTLVGKYTCDDRSTLSFGQMTNPRTKVTTYRFEDQRAAATWIADAQRRTSGETAYSAKCEDGVLIVRVYTGQTDDVRATLFFSKKSTEKLEAVISDHTTLGVKTLTCKI